MMQSPAELHEDLVAQPVAIASRSSAVISRAVTFDPEDELAGLKGVDDPQVDPET